MFDRLALKYDDIKLFIVWWPVAEDHRTAYIGLVGGVLSIIVLLLGWCLVVYLRRKRSHAKQVPSMPGLLPGVLPVVAPANEKRLTLSLKQLKISSGRNSGTQLLILDSPKSSYELLQLSPFSFQWFALNWVLVIVMLPWCWFHRIIESKLLRSKKIKSYIRIFDCAFSWRFLRSGNIDRIGQRHVVLLPRTLSTAATAATAVDLFKQQQVPQVT